MDSQTGFGCNENDIGRPATEECLGAQKWIWKKLDKSVRWATVFLRVIRFPDAIGRPLCGRCGKAQHVVAQSRWGSSHAPPDLPLAVQLFPCVVILCKFSNTSFHRPGGDWCYTTLSIRPHAPGNLHSHCLLVIAIGVAVGFTICELRSTHLN